jgi:ATP-dependent DNA helicase RecG
MTTEDQHVERKSLRLVTGRTADWPDIAWACVCFANASGGRLLVGIENDAEHPPAEQVIPHDLPELLRRRVGELTVNVQALPVLQRAANGGEYVEVLVERSSGVASTSDGRYFLRVGDACLPVLGDDVMRLAADRPQRPWETLDSGVAAAHADAGQVQRLVDTLRASARVKQSVKEKGDAELLVHYGLVHSGALTHLGVLLVGDAAQRRTLRAFPIVQAIRYDDDGRKINKWTWDDGELSPLELPEAIWREIPDFRESYEIPDGMLRQRASPPMTSG